MLLRTLIFVAAVAGASALYALPYVSIDNGSTVTALTGSGARPG